MFDQICSALETCYIAWVKYNDVKNNNSLPTSSQFSSSCRAACRSMDLCLEKPLFFFLFFFLVLPLLPALNISQLVNHHPGGTTMHFTDANVWVYLDPFLRAPLCLTAAAWQILPPFQREHRTIIIDSCTIKAGLSETDSFEMWLAKMLSEMEV